MLHAFALRAFCALWCFVVFPFYLCAQVVGLRAPSDFLPHRLGEQFTPHHMLCNYYAYLAANAPSTMRLEQYGQTNEARPLQVAIFSAPENLVRLEQIRRNNLDLAGLGTRPGSTDSALVIVWLSMTVHGNETSGAESGMELAWRLASQTDPDIQAWLKNTLVIIDPALNPDGYDRYTHWYRMAANRWHTAMPDSREHHEPWPGGRPNHYYFDLNRDWAWGTQAETQQRLKIFQRWLPHIHADLHEQGPNEPYYFAPAAEPMHAYVTPWQREFQTKIGQNHAIYFNRENWLYFTKEVFDLLYPSYGDTYPMFNGAIGMTYEQGGLSTAGRALILDNGDTLTLRDRILHHLTSSISTIEIASKNARQVVERFRDFYNRTATQPLGPYVTFVIKASNDPNKVNQLCKLLDQHQIRYGLAGANSAPVKAFSYLSGQETTTTVQAGDLIINAYQPRSVLVQVLFEPETHLSDSLTYDITAWAIPFAYGFDALALKTRIDYRQPYVPYKAQEAMISSKPYAWSAHRHSMAEAQWVAALLRQGIRIRYASKPFEVGNQQFAPGSFVILRSDNKEYDEVLDGLVKNAAAAANVDLTPLFSGYLDKGPDLGSDAYKIIPTPHVAMIYGEEVDENAFGHVWFFFEQELGYPIIPIAFDRLQRTDLKQFTTLILPGGQYTLSDPVYSNVRSWVREGGRLIVLDYASQPLGNREGIILKQRSDPKKDSAGMQPRPFQGRERYALSDQLSGAIFRAKVDNTHPLGYGLGEYYFALKTQNTIFDIPSSEEGATAIWLEDKYQSYGFVGSRLKPRLQKTPLVTLQSMNRGSVVYMTDQPLFRCFWQQGKLLLVNALFH
jgi:Zinc carboxypeptidase